MKIPRYWARESYSTQAPDGKTVSAVCWRWSDSSVEEARQQAKIGAQQIASKLLNKQHLDRYGYGERPMREEVTQTVSGTQNKELAILTRNAYGALVLNAANAMFIDIDFAEEKRSAGPLGGLFGKKAPSQEAVHLERIEQWSRRNPGVDLRVYRTFGGLRCLVTSDVFDPTDESTRVILTEMESDPLYVRLCRGQGCFRARLTPKPWRCGVGKPPLRYPWENMQDEIAYRQWEAGYNRAASNYTVCKLVKEIGRGAVHPEVAPIVALHDQAACSARELALA